MGWGQRQTAGQGGVLVLKYGYWSIILGYFIPGIRHLMCCFSGISRMAIGRYVLVSSIGAFIWCVVFISIGFYVGVLT